MLFVFACGPRYIRLSREASTSLCILGFAGVCEAFGFMASGIVRLVEGLPVAEKTYRFRVPYNDFYI